MHIHPTFPSKPLKYLSRATAREPFDSLVAAYTRNHTIAAADRGYNSPFHAFKLKKGKTSHINAPFFPSLYNF